MSVILQRGELYLTGMVDDDPTRDHFTATDVLMALAEVDPAQMLPVHLNSPGGWATEGAAIYALLTARRGETNIIIEGMAASAASLIAMAGKTISMAAGSLLMIHDPSGVTIGTAQDHRRTIEGLEAISRAYSQVYAFRSGKTVKQCLDIMQAETWYTPEQAVAAGFADKASKTTAKVYAAFDYSQFRNAPEKLVALAKDNQWTQAGEPPVPTPIIPPKETTMSTDTAQLRADAKARIKAILASPEADGRSELAEHLAFDTDMTPEAATAMLAKAAKQQPTTPAESAESTYEKMRMSAVGRTVTAAAGALGRPATPGSAAVPSSLVANMKRRHGIS